MQSQTHCNSITAVRQEISGLPSLDKYYENNCNNAIEPRAKKKHYCEQYSFIAQFDNGSTKVIRHRCKTWGCGVCGPKKLKQVKLGIYKQADKFKLCRMLTLTLPGNYQGTADESIRDINRIWSKFRVYLKRRFKDKIHFIKIVEVQRRGAAHLHVLIDRFIPQGWISSAWSDLGGGKIVDIRFVDLHRVSGYVSKYMTKDMLSLNFGNYRRYGTSQGIRIVEKIKSAGGEWKFTKSNLDAYFKHAIDKMSGNGGLMNSLNARAKIENFEVNFTLLM